MKVLPMFKGNYIRCLISQVQLLIFNMKNTEDKTGSFLLIQGCIDEEACQRHILIQQ